MPEWLPREQWPHDLAQAVGGEEVLFAVREGRYISRAGTIGGYVVGAILAIIGYFGYPHFAAIAVGALGLFLLVMTPIWRTRPGGIVVATPTRLLRSSGRVGKLKMVEWSAYEGVKVYKDGSMMLERPRDRQQSFGTINQIVEPPHAPTVAEIVRNRIAGGPSLTPQGAGSAPGHRFAGALLPERSFAILGVAFMLIGLGLIVFTSYTLLSGGTLTFRRGGRLGTPYELDGSDPRAWFPTFFGLIFGGAGVYMARKAFGKPPRATFEVTAEGLVATEESGASRVYAWEQFTGAPERRSSKGRTILSIPRETHGGRRGQLVRETLRIADVDDLDAAETHIREHLRGPTR